MSTIEAITVPKWGLTMTEGTLAEWLVVEGDEINAGDPIAEIETSKIINTIESPISGRVRKLVAQPGDTFPIGALLGVVCAPSVTHDEVSEFIHAYRNNDLSDENNTDNRQQPTVNHNSENTASSTPAVVTESLNQRSESLIKLSQGEDDSQIHASHYAAIFAKKHAINLHNVKASGRNHRINRRDVKRTLIEAGGKIEPGYQYRRSCAAPSHSDKNDETVKATSVARRLAKKLGINLNDCRASGDRGRVCKADVEACAAMKNLGSHENVQALSEKNTRDHDGSENKKIALKGMRKAIAGRLQASKQQAPHYRLVSHCRVDLLLQLRKMFNEQVPSVKLSVNDFIIKAVAAALMKHPAVNVQFDGTTIEQFAHADISVAVALDDGLITPIVAQADELTVSEISQTVRQLATQAKAGTLKNAQINGGSFCISNLGMYGISQFDAIINPPQVGILAVGAIEEKVVVHNAEYDTAYIVTLSTSFDHRVVDGAVGALFMKTLKQYIEHPALMLA
jgi:pyruvate dehydrogenase E2 component (dihydrolipoyllysine-residue acetyltransferase)